MEPLYHIIRHPAAEPSEGGPPLLVLLHGYGSNEEDLMGLAPYLDPRFLIASVRAPHALDFGGFAWFPIEVKPDGLVLHCEPAREACARVHGLVEALKTEYGVEKVLLLGFSQGASIAVCTALAHAGLCAGVAFLSGVCVPEMMPPGDGDPGRGLPVLATHGRQDPLIPNHQARSSRELLEGLLPDLDYREYDMGHEINPECLQDVRNWLSQRLDADTENHIEI